MNEKLTVEEKIGLLNGQTNWQTKNIKRIELGTVFMSDGPHGLRKELRDGSTVVATLFPALSTLACSFNKDLAYKMGEALAKEAKKENVDIILGPGVNIKRNPRCGRNFEYFSEDPVHSGKMAAKYIEGMQNEGVASCVKHFAVNSQETYRLNYDAVVDERALREIYLKAFKYAIDAKVKSIMASYNKINGVYSCENPYLLKTILRDEFGFKGVVISDWGAVCDPVASFKNGLNLEMPNSKEYNLEKVRKAYNNKQITEEEIDEANAPLLRMIENKKDFSNCTVDYDSQHELARDIARDSIVLMKNDNILPLKKEEKVLFVGGFFEAPRIQGGGSSKINTYKVETVQSEIDSYNVNYDYLEGFSSTKDIYEEQKQNEVLEKVRNYDKVVVMAGLIDETEGLDRDNILLPSSQLKLINEIVKINNNVVVVLSLGSAVELSFNDDVKGIVNCYLLGQASGRPLLDILYGITSPSGRLCETYANHLEDYITSKNFANGNNAVWYEESIYVGYRYFTTFDKEVMYPFGYGLSYSKFEYSNLKLSTNKLEENKKINISVDVKNVGSMKAKEVVQLYVRNNLSSVYKAKRELKDFVKIELETNEIKKVEFELDYEDFAYYDVLMKKNYVNKGIYAIEICRDANTVILSEDIEKKVDSEAFKSHEQTIYNSKEFILLEKEFKKIMKKELPPINEIRKKPYTMNSTANDFKSSFTGRIIYKIMLKMANSMVSSQMSEIEKRSRTVGAMEIPLRTIAFMAGEGMDYIKCEGIVDMANGHFIKGLKKYLKK